MAKVLQEKTPRSASSLVGAPVGGGMRLDDLSETVNEQRHEQITSSLASGPPTVAQPAPVVRIISQEKKKREMLSTPIDADLRQLVRKLRYEYRISEAFILEVALRSYFEGRNADELADDLRSRGGRLRRQT